MISFSLIDPLDWRDAYQWHRGFVASNDLVFPRTIDQYARLAEEGQIWCARDSNKEFLGLAYYQLGESAHLKCEAWEVGGLMVATSQRKRGVGSAIVCLTLGHVLFEEDPLARGTPVVAHVHEQNISGPRSIFQNLLKFDHACTVQIEGKRLPGLRTDEHGFVRGDEFMLSQPATLRALAEWCRGWPKTLREGETAMIDFGPGRSLPIWAQAFDKMASGKT